MRLFLFIAVIALLVDAYFYSGAHTRSAYMQVKIVAQEFVDYIGDTVDVGTERKTSREITRI